MKKLLGLFVLACMFLTIGFASAVYDRPCDAPVDLCEWKTVTGSPLILPLANQNSCGPYVGAYWYNTYWAVNTDTTAICEFTGDSLAETKLYISVDNDIKKCTLTNSKYPEGIELITNYRHVDCAPVDPKNGLLTDLSEYVADGKNTLVCDVHDYGGMTYFDACVVSTGTPSNVVPEFGAIVAVLTVMGALGVFFVVRKQ